MQVVNPSFFRLALAACLCIAMSMCRKSAPSPHPNQIIETDTPVVSSVSTQVNGAFGGYCIGLPALYPVTTKQYPLLVFLHGAGQMGNGTTDLHYILNDGIGKLLKKGTFPPSFQAAGKTHSFIVVSPQYSRAPSADEIGQFVLHIRQQYRVDASRLYVAGLSLGAKLTTLVGAKFADSVAAIVPIAGVATNSGMEDRCAAIAAAGLPVWALHNLDDPLSDVKDLEQFISIIGAHSSKVSPKLTIFDDYGHDAWSMALDPGFRENGMNIYEWMLRFTR